MWYIWFKLGGVEVITTKKIEIGELNVTRGVVLWEGLQTSAGTIQLSQPLTDFAYILIESCYNNNNTHVRSHYHYINFDAGNLKYEDVPYILALGTSNYSYYTTYRLGDSNGNSDCITVVKTSGQYMCQIIGFR